MRMGIFTGRLYTEEEYLSRDDINECCCKLKESDLENPEMLDKIYTRNHLHCLFCNRCYRQESLNGGA